MTALISNSNTTFYLTFVNILTTLRGMILGIWFFFWKNSKNCYDIFLNLKYISSIFKLCLQANDFLKWVWSESVTGTIHGCIWCFKFFQFPRGVHSQRMSSKNRSPLPGSLGGRDEGMWVSPGIRIRSSWHYLNSYMFIGPF